MRKGYLKLAEEFKDSFLILNAGVISKKIEGNPLSPEKIEKEKKVAEKEEASKEAAPAKKN